MAAPDPPAKFSLALGSKKAAPKQTTKKRPHSTLHDSDDEDAAAPQQQPQEVSHFDASAGGAIDASKPTADRGPLVIPKQGNRDWRAESQARKRQKSQLPSRAQQQTNGDAEHFEEEKPVFGLNVVKRAAAAEESADGDGDAETGAPAEPPPPPKTEDQLALEALLGEGKSSSLVVPIAENEEEAYQRDYERAPDVATLEEYEAVPVEEFGAAMLRGMGWKEGEAIGRRKGLKAVQPRVVERRPALLGIGAKPDAAIAEELGAWGKGGKASRGKPVQSYNPVVMRNTKTGEQLTEEELKQKVADQEAEALARERERTRKKDSPARDSERRLEKSSRRHKYDEGDYESDRRDRDRRKREKDSDWDFDSKNRSSRRDRSASDEDRNRRRKYDSKDYDRRDRNRERDRKHRDRSRDYSKSSSRREHRDRDRSRDRYRDSDRERRRRRDD